MWHFNLDNVNLYAYKENAFTKDECKKIIDIAKKQKLKTGLLGTKNNKDSNVRDSKICWLREEQEEVKWIYRRIADIVLSINSKFFNFDLLGISESLQFTNYKAPSGKYGKHIDRAYGITVRKLSVSIQLTDPKKYKGGELRLYDGADKHGLVMNKNQGTLVVFPSYVLHEVSPVTKGERNSLVAWIQGNQFK